jgi:opacity protein-like surface antigen
MKRASITAFLIFILSSLSLAAHTSPVVDTIKVNGNGTLSGFVASWGTPTVVFSVTTTLDTLTAPAWGNIAEIVHGGTTGDTIQISYAQLAPNGVGYVTKFTESLVAGNEVAYRDFGEAGIKRIIIKGNGTIRARVKIIGRKN